MCAFDRISRGNRAAALCVFFTPALLSLASHAWAQPAAVSTQYAVEIIVFRSSSIGAAEDWSAAPPGRGFGNQGTRGGAPQLLRVLAPSDYKLAGVETTLRSSGAWHPIAHAAWVQTAANWGTHIGVPLADLGINSPGLTGTVYLERASYLHLGVDLRLSGGAADYAINEMRSIKLNERQYFDHPAFGVIAVVSAVSAAAAAAQP